MLHVPTVTTSEDLLNLHLEHHLVAPFQISRILYLVLDLN